MDEKDYAIIEMVEFPGTPEERFKYLLGVRSTVERQGKHIHNALLLTEGWFVRSDRPLSVRPSQHPNRTTAITLIGRNEAGTRQTSVVLPYAWKGDLLSIEKPALEAYNDPCTPGNGMRGLVDALFI